MCKKFPLKSPKGSIFVGINYAAVEARVLALITDNPQLRIDSKHIRTGRITHPQQIYPNLKGNMS